ncbi:MAG: hypothetical protein M1823_007951, partial [Watsoniomyces obsoletus]
VWSSVCWCWNLWEVVVGVRVCFGRRGASETRRRIVPSAESRRRSWRRVQGKGRCWMWRRLLGGMVERRVVLLVF